MPAVLLSIDCFNLGVFKEPANVAYPKKNDTGDATSLYLVLQPLILVGKAIDGLPAARWLRTDIAEYINGAPAPIGGDDHPIVTPGNYMNRQDGWPVETLKGTAIPVPFPPQTTFEMQIEFTSASGTIRWGNNWTIPTRVLQGDGIPADRSLLLDRDDWPKVGAASFMIPAIEDVDELSPKQKTELVDWLIAAVGELRAAAKTGKPVLTQRQGIIFTTYISKNAVLDPKLEPHRTTKADRPEIVQGWRAYFKNEATGKKLVKDLYAAFKVPDPEAAAPGKLKFDRPKFRYQDQIPAKAFFQGEDPRKKVVAGSYHALLWRQLSEQAANASSNTEKDQVREALQRLYGFGERLRWMKDTVGGDPLGIANQRLMVLESDSGRLNGGFGTNMHSLAGQVFRIGGVNALTGGPYAVKVKTFKINGHEPVWWATKDARPDQQHNGDGPAELAKAIQKFLASIQQYRGKTFSVSLDGDGANRNGLVLFQPKLAGLRRSADPPGWEMPRSLLDAVTNDLPFSMPAAERQAPDAPQLVVVKPPRSGLTSDEILAGKPLFQDAAVSRGRCAFKLRVRLVRRSRFSADPAMHVYDIAFTEALARTEQTLLDALLVEWSAPLSTPTPVRNLSLWIPRKDKASAIVDFGRSDIRGLPAGGQYPLPLLRVIAAAKIAEIDNNVAEYPGAAGETGFAVDLVVSNLVPYDPFNFVPDDVLVPTEQKKDKDRQWVLALAKTFTSRVSFSADRLLSRMETIYNPSPFQVATNPVLDHFANFNKCRLALQLMGRPDWTLLTYPDALVPLHGLSKEQNLDPETNPLGAARDMAPDGPHFAFPLIHHFDRELSESEGDAPGDGGGDLKPRVSEQIRYELVRFPGIRVVGGYVEHQYSARIAFAQGPQFPLRLGHDTRNVAEMHADKPVVVKNRAGKDEAKSRLIVHLLTFASSLNTPTPTLTLSFSAEYFEALFAEAWSSGEPAREVQDAYRTIYEGFADLDAALDAGTAELTVEAWAFDNARRRQASTDAELPAFYATMVRIASGTLKLNLNAKARADLKAVIDKVLANDYRGFVTNVEKIRSGGQSFAPVIVRLDATEWVWTNASRGSFDPASLNDEAHLIRAGLTVRRRDTAVIGNNFGGARFLPFAVSDDVRNRATWLSAGVTVDFDTVEPAARAELAGYLQAKDGPLYRKFAWIACGDRFRTPPDQKKAFESSLRMHFGDAVGFLDVPQSQMPAITTVSDLYYVPHGFVSIGLHPSLPDPIVTLEFAFYVARLMQAIRDGAAFDGIEVKPADVGAAESLQRRIVELLEQTNGFAEQVVRLIARVDNPAAIRKSHGADVLALYDRVDKYVADVTPGLQSALKHRFETRPADFAGLRAIGVAIFDPDRFSPLLYSLRINKRIREDLSELETQKLARSDGDEFHFTDFVDIGNHYHVVIDGLDDASYDAEFTIEQNRYVVDNKLIDDHKNPLLLGEVRQVDQGDKAKRYIALRGDAQARTAEDVIEADLPTTNPLRRRYYSDAPIESWASDPPVTRQPERSLEVNVVHFNPSWRITKSGRVVAWQYLLPSRTPPSQPTLLVPKAVLKGGKPDASLDAVSSQIFLRPGDDPGKPEPFEEIARKRLKDREFAAVEKAGAKSEGDRIELQARPEYTKCAEKIEQCAGWHCFDTVLAHHYFLIDADPKATEADPIQQDALSIEVQQFEPSVTAASFAAPVNPPLAETDLYNWFLWDRLRHQRGEAERPANKPTLAELGEQIQLCLGFDREKKFDPLASLFYGRQAPDTVSAKDTTTTIYLPKKNASNLFVSSRASSGRWPSGPSSSGVGQVVAAEIMTVRDASKKVSRYAVRVTVLEAPWRRTQVRLRVLRNYRDVDADLVNDIDPRFLMASPFSAWSERADRSLELGPKDFMREKATAGWIMETKIKQSEWLAISPFLPDGSPGRVRDLGPVLADVISTTVPQYPQYRMWSELIEEGRWRIRGEIEHRVPDAHIIAGADKLDRSHLVSRQFLVGSDGVAVKWKDVGVLTRAVDKKRALSVPLMFRFTWSTTDGKPLLQVTLPLKFDEGQ